MIDIHIKIGSSRGIPRNIFGNAILLCLVLRKMLTLTVFDLVPNRSDVGYQKVYFISEVFTGSLPRKLSRETYVEMT